MTKTNLLLRLLVSPVIFLLMFITIHYNLIKYFIMYLRHGGEYSVHEKDDKKYIRDIYKLLKDDLINRNTK